MPELKYGSVVNYPDITEMEGYYDNSEDKLKHINGYPPDMTEEIVGCPFYDRCLFKQDVCFQKIPHLRHLNMYHKIACHIDI